MTTPLNPAILPLIRLSVDELDALIAYAAEQEAAAVVSTDYPGAARWQRRGAQLKAHATSAKDDTALDLRGALSALNTECEKVLAAYEAGTLGEGPELDQLADMQHNAFSALVLNAPRS